MPNTIQSLSGNVIVRILDGAKIGRSSYDLTDYLGNLRVIVRNDAQIGMIRRELSNVKTVDLIEIDARTFELHSSVEARNTPVVIDRIDGTDRVLISVPSKGVDKEIDAWQFIDAVIELIDLTPHATALAAYVPWRGK